jgi:hypothetical protein
VDLESAAEELYSLPPALFTARRDEVARQARTEGDAALAREIRALRKPSVAAWMVNQLARRRPEQVERLAELGAELRDATQRLNAGQLRDLGRKRNELVTAATDVAAVLAAESGAAVGEGTSREVRATLEAAVLDADVAAGVRSARLTRSLTAVGLGVGESAAGAGDRPGTPTPQTQTSTESGEGEAAEAAVAEAELAEAELAEAEAVLADARRAEVSAAAVRQDLAQLLAEARSAERSASDAVRAAERRVAAARRGGTATRTSR